MSDNSLIDDLYISFPVFSMEVFIFILVYYAKLVLEIIAIDKPPFNIWLDM